MPAKTDLGAVFERLKPLLQRHADNLIVTDDGPGGYSLNTHFSPRWQKQLFFGAVQIKKNYVSYYVMPVYMYPDLLDGVSAALKKRMQGKSCFNFTAIDEALLAELAALTDSSAQRCKRDTLASSSAPDASPVA